MTIYIDKHITRLKLGTIVEEKKIIHGDITVEIKKAGIFEDYLSMFFKY